jgi:site-specific DNA-cytosine methylase
VFRLVRRKRGPRWLLIENVPFMLQLGRGAAMRHITGALDELGYTWAYRVVDARAFGLPQRRQRVLMLASRTEDPRGVLFGEDAGPRVIGDPEVDPCGFYWTEGVRGLGWAVRSASPARPPFGCRPGRSSRRGSRTPNASRASTLAGRHPPPRCRASGRATAGSWSATR